MAQSLQYEQRVDTFYVVKKLYQRHQNDSVLHTRIAIFPAKRSADSLNSFPGLVLTAERCFGAGVCVCMLTPHSEGSNAISKATFILVHVEVTAPCTLHMYTAVGPL